MTEHEKIEQLMTTVPTVQLTKWQRIQRAVGQLLGLVAVVALVLSLFAMNRAVGVGNCINSLLGERAAPTATDAIAHAKFAKSQAAWAVALSDVLAAPKADQPAAYLTFLKVNSAYDADLNSYAHTLKADQDQRNQHPLGVC